MFWDSNFVKFFTNGWESVKGAWNAAIKFLSDMWNTCIDFVRKTWEEFTAWFAEHCPFLSAALGVACAAMQVVWVAFVENLKTTWGVFRTSFELIMDAVRAVFETWWGWIKMQLKIMETIWDNTLGHFVGTWKEILGFLYDFFVGWWDGLKKLFDFSFLWNGWSKETAKIKTDAAATATAANNALGNIKTQVDTTSIDAAQAKIAGIDRNVPISVDTNSGEFGAKINEMTNDAQKKLNDLGLGFQNGKVTFTTDPTITELLWSCQLSLSFLQQNVAAFNFDEISKSVKKSEGYLKKISEWTPGAFAM
jgi:hypothetical protein